MTNLNKKQIIQALQNQDCFSLNNFTIKINPDDCPDSPRDWDNLGQMVCFHNRYDLGDKHNFADSEELAEFLSKNKANLIVLPLYLYDHSGLAMSTTPFHCPWDSGQVGFIYAQKNQENLSEEQIKQILLNEVATYNQYLNGEVFAFEVLKGSSFVSGLFGYYDKADCINEAIMSFEEVYLEKPAEPTQPDLFG